MILWYYVIALDDLADKFKFNKFYLSKIIKSYTGKNFIKIVQDIKMRKALELILCTTEELTRE